MGRRPTATRLSSIEDTPGDEVASPGWRARSQGRRQDARASVPARGWAGTGGGAWPRLQLPPRFRATTSQVCGMWPLAAGAGAPLVGVPMGRHLMSGATVCCDPISWFQRAGVIMNPSMMVFGLPGYGKSTFVRHMITGLCAAGVDPMVLGDLKPDYVKLIGGTGTQSGLEGTVAAIRPGGRGINLLDVSHARGAHPGLSETARRDLWNDAQARRLDLVMAVLGIVRGRAHPLREIEALIVERALTALEARWQAEARPGEPLMRDLVDVVQTRPEEVRSVTLDGGSDARYDELSADLVRSLMQLARDSSGGLTGGVFAGPTADPAVIGRPLVYDLSALENSHAALKGAALLACWSQGFAAIAAHQAEAAEDLVELRHQFIVMDELWRTLEGGPGIVDRINRLTRLNRTEGVGQVMITHSLADMAALPTEEERRKAVGFAERAAIKVFGALPPQEFDMIDEVVDLSRAERRMLASWSDPQSLGQARGDGRGPAGPAGMGKFLIKVGGATGIPIEVKLTPAELSLSDTNDKWDMASSADRVLLGGHR